MQRPLPDLERKTRRGGQQGSHCSALSPDQTQRGASRAAIYVKSLKGRQILFFLRELCRLFRTDSAVLEFQDLLSVEMKGGGLRACMTTWDLRLVGILKCPDVDVLETLVRM